MSFLNKLIVKYTVTALGENSSSMVALLEEARRAGMQLAVSLETKGMDREALKKKILTAFEEFKIKTKPKLKDPRLPQKIKLEDLAKKFISGFREIYLDEYGAYESMAPRPVEEKM